MTDISDDILFSPAVEQRAALDSGAFTAVELAQAYLDRIDRFNAELKAYVEVDRDGALAAARAADDRLSAGDRTPVLGLCVGIKDLIDVKGLHTTYGSKAFADNVAQEDAPVVAWLRNAGAVILGKVNTTEFALFSPNTIDGASLNPWDHSRTAGGSSNGSATATSSGLCSFAVGTDTAGSIRTPSSFCGLFGLKPTHGRVPAAGIGELSTYMDTVGPIGRSSADIALALQVMAGFEPSDLTSADKPVPDYVASISRGLDGVVIGAPDEHMADVLEPAIHAAWRDALGRLEKAGAVVRPIKLPDFEEAMTIWRGLVVGDALLWHEQALAERGDLYSEAARMILQSNASAPATDTARARREQWKLRSEFIAALEGVDVLLLPGAPVLAPLNQEIADNALTSGDRKVGGQVMLDYAIPFNVTGLPALIVPVGKDVQFGLPVPLMLSAKPFAEDKILAVAYALERLMPYDTRPDCFK
jgi:aspartyl-tRNA(Asn)/glutamyl-tRNA(Gln) amidotransferase subunit A